MSKNPLSDEDKALFRQAMRHVKPLQSDGIEHKSKLEQPNSKSSITISATPNPIPKVIKKSSNDFHNRTIINESYQFIGETVSGESILSYRKTGVSEKKYRELKKGKIRWELTLDLHGQSYREATVLLPSFIHHAMKKKVTCVLVIHGKGEKNHQPPILKNYVYSALPTLQEVVAFHSAIPAHGGSGAIYVLLQSTL